VHAAEGLQAAGEQGELLVMVLLMLCYAAAHDFSIGSTASTALSSGFVHTIGGCKQSQGHLKHHRRLTEELAACPRCDLSYVLLQRVAIMLLFRSGLLCDDEVRLQTIVPYLLTQLSDSNAGVRCVHLVSFWRYYRLDQLGSHTLTQKLVIEC
jgi:hypothetical protein